MAEPGKKIGRPLRKGSDIRAARGAILKGCSMYETVRLSGISMYMFGRLRRGNQPDDGVEVSYQITMGSGDLEGCTVAVVEQLYGRDGGAWGIFDIEGDVGCDHGGFSFISSGAWDGNGFHAAGDIVRGQRQGRLRRYFGSSRAASRSNCRCRKRHF